MALRIKEITDLLVSHAQATGYFEYVNEHESRQSGTNGISAGIWVESINPIKSSGLASASVRIEFEMRIYASTYADPYDDIELRLAEATDAMFTSYIGDFELAGDARHIDVFGAYGRNLNVRAGFINQAGKEFRVFQIQIPVIVNDVWDESP